jgi:uncharacterized damage-inducible protein DinB
VVASTGVDVDLLDRFLGHDAGTTRELLELSRDLTDEQLDRPLGIDHGTLRADLTHLVEVMEAWTDMMLGQPIRFEERPRDSRPSIDVLRERFESVALDFAALARQVQSEGRFDDTFVDVWQRRRKTLGAGIVHVITHSMAHRAHILAMLDRLGATNLPEGDALGWERRRRGGSWDPA